MPAGFNGKDDVMTKGKSFGGSAEREDVLGNFERGMKKLMRKAIRDALKTKGIKHRVIDGAIVITQEYREYEKWEHHFSIETNANHI